MAAVSISPLPVQIGIPVSSSAPDHWTRVQIQRFALNAFAAFSVVVGGVVSAVSWNKHKDFSCLGLAASIPAALAILSRYYASSLIDYEDPRIRMGLHAEAASIPLLQIVKKYGWQNLFRYEICTRDRFETIYRATADMFSFSEILKFYHEAREGLVKAAPNMIDPSIFRIPLPLEWKAKFDAETLGMGCSEILVRYPLSDLKSFDILSPHQQQILDRANSVVASAASRLREHERQCEKRKAPHQRALEVAKELAHHTYRANPAHAHLERIEIDHIRGRMSWWNAWKLKQPIVDVLCHARALRDSTIANAQEMYRLATNPIDEDLARFLTQNEVARNAELDSLTRAYHST